MVDNIVIFCASHLDSIRRIEFFIEMLESYRYQTVNARFYISISYDPKLRDSVAKVLRMINDMKLANFQIYPMLSRLQLDQFEHYKILSQLDIPNDPWIIFSDDDDLWHKLRVEFCSRISAEIEEENYSVIYYPYHTNGQREGNTLEDWLTKENKPFMHKDVTYEKIFPEEYFLTSCRLSSFRGFFQQAKDVHLKHTYCDFLFLKYLSSALSIFTALESGEFKIPLYHYRHDKIINHGNRNTDRIYGSNHKEIFLKYDQLDLSIYKNLILYIDRVSYKSLKDITYDIFINHLKLKYDSIKLSRELFDDLINTNHIFELFNSPKWITH